MDKEQSIQKEVKAHRKAGTQTAPPTPLHCGSGSMKPDWVLGRNILARKHAFT